MIADDEAHLSAIAELDAADTVIFGRVKYQLFADSWPAAAVDPTFPEAMHAYGRTINAKPKIVFSHTLQKAEWENTRLIREDAAEELTKLKQLPGGDLLIAASPTLTQSLMDRGVIDEYRLLLHPSVVGSGARFFPEGAWLKLRLVESKRFASGIVAITYRPNGKDR